MNAPFSLFPIIAALIPDLGYLQKVPAPTSPLQTMEQMGLDPLQCVELALALEDTFEHLSMDSFLIEPQTRILDLMNVCFEHNLSYHCSLSELLENKPH